ncbi:sigma-54-dependent transcriptional regulator [Desulfoplanes sp.]
MNAILLIDDEPVIHDLVAAIAHEMGLTFRGAATLSQGLELAQTCSFDAVLLDVLLPDGNGLEELARLKACPGNPEVVVITGYGDSEGARRALGGGSWQYLQKPLEYENIRTTLEQILALRKHAPQNKEHRDIRREGIVGQSPEIERCLTTLAHAAKGHVNVLISGETGTGKELFARAVHANSKRAQGPFVVLDCASLTPNLIASHLFGHVRGAFTGADQARDGLIGQAHQGTLFLDEVGELPMEIQATFLRTLETGMYRPVGGKTEKHSSFRLVAATNRNLEALAREERFRSDLLYRLRTVGIHLPALRERNKDIAVLCDHYLSRLCRTFDIDPKRMSQDFRDTMIRYEWPGNVRELVHALERAIAEAGSGPELYACHLPLHIRTAVTVQTMCPGDDGYNQPDGAALQSLTFPPIDQPLPGLREFREQADIVYVRELLKRTNRVMTRAAKQAGVSRGYLYELVKKLGIAEG